MTNHFAKFFTTDLRDAFRDLAIIVGVIAFFQVVVIRAVPENITDILLGLLIVGVGLALFVRGLEVGIFPLGEKLATHFASGTTRFWLILFAFIIGFATTIAEPALIAVAQKAAIISDGALNAGMLRLVVALSVGFAIVLGVLRILFNHAIHWYIITGYVLVLVATYFAPKEIVGLAYDSGGVTTSTVTVPLITALGVGLASTLKGRNPIIDGFGLIAFASLTPMIFVQLYGVLVYNFGFNTTLSFDVFNAFHFGTMSLALGQFGDLISGFFSTLKDVVPIIAVIFFFHYIILRKKVEQLGSRIFGFLLVIVGLYAFIVGLELGLFPIGETMAHELTALGNVWMVYAFAFAIGFATTMAEPALIAIAKKAEEVSWGQIKQFYLRLFVAAGVGVGLLFGAYRIVHGDSIVYYIIAGYLAVVALTFMVPRSIIPIAYDSGGVTTSTVTVPLVAALGIGLAEAIPGRSALIDGFGLIAFASLFPIITVLLYGFLKKERIRHYIRKNMKNADLTAR